MSKTFSITELAQEFAVTNRAIRFYETEGMLTPLREGQRRIYRPRDRVRLKLILRGKRLGLSLQEIREIIDLYDAAKGEAGQLQLLLDKIESRREDLEHKRRDIDTTLADLDDVAAKCRERLRQLDLDQVSQETSDGSAKSLKRKRAAK
ncbi:MerR family DNA-binding transcriptional regulator [Denitrobaculum tricleocarpae]|uniref:MerR family DNA-binding transcriptional regulator n=2 Tax=Denitrobaculum tricleocarpae TaxID=2591009 RepID=A0A545TLD4_9PROT|nr:MerR family DNA-binding transcriptional regulator [Denitrobaculum tricleocarpae]TQV78006.1 MerR family DNA-binding transcriptional regulator [Denitrobaculum tricleocarpae]